MTLRSNLMMILITTNSALSTKKAIMTTMMMTKTLKMSLKKKLEIKVTWMMKMIKLNIFLAKTPATLLIQEETELRCYHQMIRIRDTKICMFRPTLAMMMIKRTTGYLFQDGTLTILNFFCRRSLDQKRIRRKLDQISIRPLTQKEMQNNSQLDIITKIKILKILQALSLITRIIWSILPASLVLTNLDNSRKVRSSTMLKIVMKIKRRTQMSLLQRWNQLSLMISTFGDLLHNMI